MLVSNNSRFVSGRILLLVLASLWLLIAACGGSKKTAQTEQAPPEPEVVRPQPQRETPPPPPPVEAPRALDPIVLENVYFDYDKFDLTSTARDVLNEHARVLRSRPEARLLIEGHCDERGTIEYNLALGDKRARAVMNYLTSLGIERTRLSTVSYGKERPLDLRQNETAWAKNRRAQFNLTAQ